MNAISIVSLPMLGAAAENARHGLPVYPARPRGKAPLHKGWQRSATPKIEHLTKLWAATPEANVGVLCRDHVVLDADSGRGEDAVADLGLPPTTTVRTRRGSHYYFAGKASTARDLLPDVEVRGTGSGVLGAGSIHPSGAEYVWEIPPWEIPPIPLPPTLQELIDQHRGTTETAGTTGLIAQGQRNHELTRLAGSLRGRFGLGELESVLQAANIQWCRPPLDRAEVAKIARSASRWSGPPEWVADPITYTCADPDLSTLARFVLRLLCDHSHDDGTCYPGLRRLERLAKTSRRRVVAAISELEQAGRISVERSRRGNRYRLLPLSPSPSKGGSSGSHVGTTEGREAA